MWSGPHSVLSPSGAHNYSCTRCIWLAGSRHQLLDRASSLTFHCALQDALSVSSRNLRAVRTGAYSRQLANVMAAMAARDDAVHLPPWARQLLRVMVCSAAVPGPAAHDRESWRL